jgi:hypothetical protein
MKIQYAILPLSLVLFSYTQLSDYSFVHTCKHAHIRSEYRQIGNAEFDSSSVKGSKLAYADGYANLFLSHHLNRHNALSWEAGYTYMNIDWDENPRFSQKQFNIGTASLAWISTSVDCWRWILRGGASVDTHSFNFGHTGVYHGLLWGRYQHTERLGLHLGAFGYGGIHNYYVMPVIGFDWLMSCKWRLNVIFPLDMAIRYYMSENWTLKVAYSGFGGPYRYPFRARGGEGSYSSPIFMIHSNGADIDLKYHYKNTFYVSIGGGYNFGGWILIRNNENHHGKYYDYNTAPYALADFGLTF